MTLTQTVLLTALLLSIAAGLWHSAAAFRDRPLFIAASAAATAGAIAFVAPPLRPLGLIVLCAGASIAYARWAITFVDSENARRTSAVQRDTAPLTAFFVAGPPAFTVLYALFHVIPWPGEPTDPQWLHHTLVFLTYALLLSAASAARAAAWPAIAARFAAAGEDPSNSQRVMICATIAPLFTLSLSLPLLVNLGIFGHAGDLALLAGSRIILGIAGLMVVPGFPLAWWWAARLHRAAQRRA